MIRRLTVAVAVLVGLLMPAWGRAAEAAAARFPSVPFVVACTAVGSRADDPIMAPGRPGDSHLHAFFGARLSTSLMSHREMLSAQTSCDQPGDHASYWVPGPVGSVLRAYYDAGPLDPSLITAYPPGQQLVAGNPSVWQPPGVDVVGWRCGRDADGPDTGSWSARPVSTCAAGTARIARLTFPQCSVAGSVSYRDVVSPVAGRCPGDHPVALPRLRVLVRVPGDSVSSGPLVTFHGDFLNGWSPVVLERLVRVCTRGERARNVELKICGLPGGS